MGRKLRPSDKTSIDVILSDTLQGIRSDSDSSERSGATSFRGRISVTLRFFTPLRSVQNDIVTLLGALSIKKPHLEIEMGSLDFCKKVKGQAKSLI